MKGIEVKNKATKIALAVILGAFGSGIWDIAVKPICIWLFDIILNALTFFTVVLSDSIYGDIAQGRTDRIGMFMLSVSTGIIVGALLMKIVKKQKENKDGNEKKNAFSDQLIVVLLSSMLVFTTLKNVIVITKINDFEHMYSIAKPLYTEKEADRLKSTFGQIASYKDYKTVMTKLVDSSSNAQYKVPSRLKRAYQTKSKQ